MTIPPDSSSGQQEDAEQFDDATAQPAVDPQVAAGPTSDAAPEPAPGGGDVTVSPSTLPPEAQGEANGGPLGCCLGVMVGLLLSLSIALLSRFYADPLARFFGPNLSLIVRVLMGIVAFVAVIVCGRFGWRIGKIFYREYEPPVVKEVRHPSKSVPRSRSRRIPK
ncbi:MAG TPA: hypothetical protein VKX46_02640 [Ktedonobacteraceae bacterium]|nr:hypothetical protein [Ktedonobacteraceae bacterium]